MVVGIDLKPVTCASSESLTAFYLQLPFCSLCDYLGAKQLGTI